MMKAVENYKKIINDVTPSLRERGFKKSGASFYLQNEESWGIVNFQKSTKSSSEHIVFTVNLGVASKRLLKLSSTLHVGSRPGIWDCHWQERLGHLLEEKKDVWWTVEYQTPIDQLSHQIQEYIFNFGVSEVLKYMSDESLRALWLSDKSPSLTKIQRLKYLSVLLKEIGPRELLDSVQDELQRTAGNRLP